MKKIKNILVIAIFAFSTVSCSDFLDVNSEQSTMLSNFYRTAEECKAATGNLYGSPWYSFNGRFATAVGDARSNNIYNDQVAAPSGIFNRLVDTESTVTLIDGWNSLYSVSAHASLVLKYIDVAYDNGVDPRIVDGCKGEAHFMRGVSYWYLTSLWGNVPIVEDPEVLALNYVVNSNYQEDVLQFAIKELELAAELLPVSDAPGRLTKNSAYGMLARVYITAANYARGNKFTTSRYPLTATQYYEKAKEAAKIVCEAKPNDLMDDYEQLFRVQNNNNSESLFALQWVPGTSSYGYGNVNQARLAKFTEIMDGDETWGGNEYASGELLELMYNRGENSRRRGTFFVGGAAYNYLTIADGSNFVVPEQNLCNIKKHVVGRSTDTGVPSISQNSGLTTPMMRLAEVYLLYAEAILGLNNSTTDTEALRYFNKVRARAGLNDVTSITLQDIWNERRIELGMEAQFWYDIVRRAYWDETWVIDFMNGQRRAYRYEHPNPTSFTWGESDGREGRSATSGSLLIDYPAEEKTLNPLLTAPPVHYDVN